MQLLRLAALAALMATTTLAQAGTVTVLTSFPKELTTAYQKAFEAKNPGEAKEFMAYSTASEGQQLLFDPKVDRKSVV